MEKEDLYVHYVLSKCKTENVEKTLPIQFRTKAKLIESYEKSSCFTADPDRNTKELIYSLEDLVFQGKHINRCSLDRDADHVFRRSQHKVRLIKKKRRQTGSYNYADLFDATTDCIWILASVTLADNKGDGMVHLIDWPTKEFQMTAQYLTGLLERIEQKKRDLREMEETKDMPGWEKMLLRLIEDISDRPSDSYINYTSSQLKAVIVECENWIIERERLFYMLAATSALRRFLSRM